MSDETQALTIVARGELERGLRATTHNVHAGFSLAISGLCIIAGGCLMIPIGLGAALVILCGVGVSILGAHKAARALPAMSTVRAKLRAQELPSARLLSKHSAR